MESIASQLENNINNYLPGLRAIDDVKASLKSSPLKWSKKQILGHLIDSAANNHQRFVRCQFEEQPLISYNQDKWNEAGHYQEMDTRHLTRLWLVYNLHLAKLIALIPEEKGKRKCLTAPGTAVTLEFLINDYVVHLEHHLRQLTAY